MEYKFECPYCHQKIQCNETNLNMDCTCPRCKENFILDPDFIILTQVKEIKDVEKTDLYKNSIQNLTYKVSNNFKDNINISLNEQNILRCPECGSHNIKYVARGYDIIRGLICCIFIPIIGLIFGIYNSTKLDCECLNCYHKASSSKFRKNITYDDITIQDLIVIILGIFCCILFWVIIFNIKGK